MTELIEQCKVDNRKAQERMYQLYYQLMYQTAKRYFHEKHEILSVVNDSFLKVCKNIQSYKADTGPFEAWLHAIVSNMALDHLRKKKGVPVYVPVDEQSEVPDNSHLQVDKPEFLIGIISGLPPVTRSVISLSLDGFSHKEVSQKLNISEAASRWHLSDAKRRIREKLV